MALRGNLRDFSLPDVFQLVAFSGKTGVLRITRPDGAEGGVWFRDGEVFFASSDWRGEALGERLVSAQRITPAALSKALAMQSAEPPGGRRLGAILVDEGYVTQGVLEAFVQEQIQDTIFDLMRWEEGDFDFEVLPDSVDEDIGLSVSLENIVMEGSRRLEEWGRIRKKIPSMDVVFKMATAPGDGSFEISLKPVEWSLLLLVDGSRSVAELAAETGRTDFDVARIVYGLVCAGLLEFVDADEIAARRVEREKRERRAGSQARTQRQAAQPQPATEPAQQPAVITSEQPAVVAPEPTPGPIAPPSPVEVHPGIAAAAAEPQPVPLPYEPAAEPQPGTELLEPFVAEELASDLLDAPDVQPEVSHGPTEEPTFLGEHTEASAHDLNVFEEMVAAVLEAPEPEVETPPAVAHEPAELPPSMNVSGEAVPGFDASDAASLLGLEPVPAPEPTPAPEPAPVPEPAVTAVPEPSVDVGQWVQEPAIVQTPESETSPADTNAEFQSVPLAEPESIAPPAPVTAPADVPPADSSVDTGAPPIGTAPEPAPDFERDLMALGLGEVPTTPDVPEPQSSPQAEEPAAPSLSDLIVTSEPQAPEAEPVYEQAAEAPPAPGMPIQPSVAAVQGQTPDVVEPDEASGVFGPDPSLLEFEALSSSLGPVSELEQLDRGEQLQGEDIDSLIASLDDEPPAPAPELPLEEVDATLGSVLNDELSALTGAQRPTQRPSATVSKIPEPGKTLQRDTAIDRETLLRIIAGIEKL